jgi:predicted nucleic acid-binding protein
VADTTALVDAIHQRRRPFLDAFRRGEMWFSSVAVSELYAGARSRGDARDLDLLVEGAARADRLLTPTADEWAMAGRLIARRIRLHGALRPRDHLADVLIVVSAARVSGEILTANVRHFDVWADLARRAGLDVRVSDAQLA